MASIVDSLRALPESSERTHLLAVLRASVAETSLDADAHVVALHHQLSEWDRLIGDGDAEYVDIRARLVADLGDTEAFSATLRQHLGEIDDALSTTQGPRA